MTAEKFNRVQILYNAEHHPYLYGAIHIVHGSLENQWWESPFVVSKRRWNGEEVVYGTVKRIVERLFSQLERLREFRSETEARLDAEGITPLIQENSVLPESEFTARILDEQDELLEDVLLSMSANIRILSEIFSRRLKRSKVNVYDYENRCIDRIELSEIANLILHNRYILIKDQYVVDLLSDEKFMAKNPQVGLKISFPEYISEVEKIINSITVKDLITKLWGLTKNLSASSNIKDIIFLTQNLYTLGGLVLENNATIGSGPLKTIMDRVAMSHIKRIQYTEPNVTKIATTLVSDSPRFLLEPDLNQKQICIAIHINGNLETLVMDYKEFFLEVSRGYGNRKLYANPVG